MGNQKKYGIKYENKEKHYWQDKGAFALRSRGSFTLFDMVVVTDMFWRLVQVKSTKQKTYSYRKELEEVDAFANAPQGTIKMLVLYHKGKRKVLYEEVVR